MRKTRVDASAFVFAIVSIAYPLLAAFLIPRLGPWPIILILVALLLARSLTSFAKRVPAIMTLGLLATAGAMAAVAAFDAHLSVRLYPVLMNAAMLTAFTHTLFDPPSMIERFARIMEPDLPESGVRYTRRVTTVWAAFFVINGAIALWTALYADWRTWSLYNGVIAYVAMGVLFAVEFAVRQAVREKGPAK